MRIVKITAGLMLLASGIAMLALPGPGWVAIVAALSLLSTELRWARGALDALKRVATRLAGKTEKGGHHGEDSVEETRSRRA